LPASDPAYLRDQLAPILREAGDIALAKLKTPLKRWTKGGNSPVSEGDIAVNDFLIARLPPLMPDAGWLSEETEDNPARTNASAVWIVDPIDGTRAYLDNRPDWTVSVALAIDGRSVVGGLYAPATNEMFLAAAGQGTTLNGKPVSPDSGAGLSGARIAGPQSSLQKLTEMAPEIVAQPKIFSLALRLARVATGALDAAFASRNSHDWDLAAADLLVHEAGGLLTDLAGQPLRYNRAQPVHGTLVAAGRARHAMLIEFLHERRNEFA